MRKITFFMAVAFVFALAAGSAQADGFSQSKSALEKGAGEAVMLQGPAHELSKSAGCGAKTSVSGETADGQPTRLAAEMEECPAGSGKRCPVGTRCHCDSKGCTCVTKRPWK